MGRTLHYSITKEHGVFKRAEKKAMIDIADKCNSGKLKDIWSCENYYFTPFHHYPNWNGKFKTVNPDEAWKQISKRWDELARTGKEDIDIYLELHSSGYIIFFHNPDGYTYKGFTKVQGNELNALLVYVALIELSSVIPDAVIELSDEGRFLYCDVKISRGLSKPILSSIHDSLRYYYELLATADKKITSKIDSRNLPEGILKDLNLAGISYDNKDVIKWINDKIRDMDEVYKRIKHLIEANYHCIHNIENQWFEPMLLCRPVNPEDFKDVNCDASTLMGGYYGDHWKLTDKDAEMESYKSIAKMQKILGLTGYGNKKLEILSKKKK